MLRQPTALILSTLFVTALLLSALGAYAVRVRNSAAQLISSALALNTSTDLSSQARIWRKKYKYFQEFGNNSDGVGGYQIEIRSGLLTTLHLVPSTGVLLQVRTRSSKLEDLTIGMYTERASVWTQQDFAQSGSGIDIKADSKGSPTKLLLSLSAEPDASVRRKAFALNPSCFTTFNGCKSSQEILPTLRDLQGP